MSESRRVPPAWNTGAALLGRRDVVARLTACFAGTALLPSAAFAQSAATCVLTPESGEGPFYFDPELVRTDIAEHSVGAPLELAIQVVRTGDCATLANARVDVWHADALGFYSGYERQRGTGEPASSPLGQTYLRGTQFTDPEGRATFRTIYPSWYQGRTPHIHFKIFLLEDEVVASQIFFPEYVNNEVFETIEPYRARRHRRDTFNENDTFLTGRTGGVFCAVEPSAGGYSAGLTVGVRPGPA